MKIRRNKVQKVEIEIVPGLFVDRNDVPGQPKRRLKKWHPPKYKTK